MKTQENWYIDWQDSQHARHLDARLALPSRSLIRNFESFSDVLLLNKRLEALRRPPLLEVGCATGEFYRYLQLKDSGVSYTGLDISEPAIVRARQKYPQGRFFVSDPAQSLPEILKAHRLDPQWPIVYSKDVLHHQTDPFGFLSELLGVCSDSLILRTRTRDQGPTLVDPERSCQHHYQGWMPYIVLNVDELIGQIRLHAPGSEIVLYRNHMVLGGRENRFLPKECYLPETGTAESAVGVFRESSHGNRVRVIDQAEGPVRHSLTDRVAMRLRRRGRKS